MPDGSSAETQIPSAKTVKPAEKDIPYALTNFGKGNKDIPTPAVTTPVAEKDAGQPPPTREELEMGISQKTKDLVKKYKEDTSGRI